MDHAESAAKDKYRLDETRHLRNGGQLTIHEEFDTHTRRLNGTWTLRRHDANTQMTPYSVRLYSIAELKALALAQGFRETTFFRDFDGQPFEPDSPELIMIAQK